MKTKFIPAVLFAFCMFSVSAQKTKDLCGTMKVLDHHIQADPAWQQEWDNYDNFMKAEEANPTPLHRAGTVVYIPVVFHIVHNGDAVGSGENISDAQVISQIDALNRDFALANADAASIPDIFKPVAANTNIQFCLAQFDPSGAPTTGIVRHLYASTPDWDENEIEGTLKPATIWTKNNYLNIWSVRMGGGLITDGVLAYAQFPFFGSANTDGVVSRYNCIGTTGSLLAGYNLGRTIVHEVGHWLGLRHTWGDDDGACTGSDNVSDTPNQADLYFGCPSWPQSSCGDEDMYMNYMDYTDDDCRTMFTVGQSTRMNNVLNNQRSSIKTSASKCFTALDAELLQILHPNDTVCSTLFKPLVRVKNNGLTAITSAKFLYSLDGDAPGQFNWTGNIASLTEAYITLPDVGTQNGSHTFEVTITNVNGAASDDDANNDNKSLGFILIDNGPSTAAPFTEDFEAAIYPPGNWLINNVNNDITWVKNTAAGGFATSTNSVSINNLGYAGNPNKKKDALITDNYNISAITYPELTFDVAYARYNEVRFDSLFVYYSLDCGSTWYKLWANGGTGLATAPDATTTFVPTATQWEKISLPLTDIATQPKVLFKFENVTGWGNVLYIDNINVNTNIALDAKAVTPAYNIQVFPNPAKDLLAVRLPFSHPFTTMRIYNAVGELVAEEKITDMNIIYNVSNLTQGLYIVQLNGDGVSQSEKVLITR
jgi:hypothetical protein